MENNPYAAPQVESTTLQRSEGESEGPREWTIGGALSVGWDAVWKDPGTLIGGFTLALVINQAAQGLMQSTLAPAGDETAIFANLAKLAVSLPIVLLISIFFSIGQMRVALSAARKEDVNFSDYFSGIDRLFIGLLVMLLMYLGLFLSAIPLVFPMFIVAVGWSLAMMLLADTTMGPKEILGESWRLTKGQRMKIFIFFLAAGAVCLLGVMALLVGVLVAIPVVTVAFAEVYMCISGRRTKEA